MQNAGQYGQGAASAHPSPQFVPSESSPNGGSTTSSLRQFRKKDPDKTHVDQPHQPSKQMPESHVARIAPHNHYPPAANDVYRYTAHQFSGYSPQIKYSDSAETSPISTSVIQKPKNKDYMEMCNVQQQQSHLNNQQYSPENASYLLKDSPQGYSNVFKPESQFFHKEQQHFQQLPHQTGLSKFNSMGNQNMRKFNPPPADNPFLNKLSKIYPSMARSIISDHHLQDTQPPSYPPMDQRMMYSQQNPRYYSGSIQPNPYCSNPNYPMNNPYPNYSPASCSYPRSPQMGSAGPRYPPHMERSLSPTRRVYSETMHMPHMNYHPVHQKMPPGHGYPPQYRGPEYAQHYQHRRVPQDCFSQPCRPPQYVQNHHQMPGQDMQELAESTVSPSDNLKKFIENWADEDPSGEVNSMEANIGLREKLRDDAPGTVYMINATDVQYFENNGIPIVTSDNGGFQVTPEHYQYLVKNGLIDNGGMVRIIEANKDASIDSNGNQERVVNLQIMEAPKSDCMMASKHLKMSESSVGQMSMLQKSDEENRRVVIHQNTILNPGHVASAERTNDQIFVSQPVVNTKELVDKNCSPINLDHLEHNLGLTETEPETEILNIDNSSKSTSSKLINDQQLNELHLSEDLSQHSDDSQYKSPGSKSMPLIDFFDESHVTENSENLSKSHSDIEDLSIDKCHASLSNNSADLSELPDVDTKHDFEELKEASLKFLEHELSPENNIMVEEKTVLNSVIVSSEALKKESILSQDLEDIMNEETQFNFSKKQCDGEENNSEQSEETNLETAPIDLVQTPTERRKRIFSVDDIIHNIGNNMKKSAKDLQLICNSQIVTDFIEKETEFSSLEQLLSISKKVGISSAKDDVHRLNKSTMTDIEHIFKTNDTCALLQVAGELMEISINVVDEKKVINVKPLSDVTIVVDSNHNYQDPMEEYADATDDNCEITDKNCHELIIDSEICSNNNNNNDENIVLEVVSSISSKESEQSELKEKPIDDLQDICDKVHALESDVTLENSSNPKQEDSEFNSHPALPEEAKITTEDLNIATSLVPADTSEISKENCFKTSQFVQSSTDDHVNEEDDNKTEKEFCEEMPKEKKDQTSEVASEICIKSQEDVHCSLESFTEEKSLPTFLFNGNIELDSSNVVTRDVAEVSQNYLEILQSNTEENENNLDNDEIGDVLIDESILNLNSKSPEEPDDYPQEVKESCLVSAKDVLLGDSSIASNSDKPDQNDIEENNAILNNKKSSILEEDIVEKVCEDNEPELIGTEIILREESLSEDILPDDKEKSPTSNSVVENSLEEEEQSSCQDNQEKVKIHFLETDMDQKSNLIEEHHIIQTSQFELPSESESELQLISDINQSHNCDQPESINYTDTNFDADDPLDFPLEDEVFIEEPPAQEIIVSDPLEGIGVIDDHTLLESPIIPLEPVTTSIEETEDPLTTFDNTDSSKQLEKQQENNSKSDASQDKNVQLKSHNTDDLIVKTIKPEVQILSPTSTNTEDQAIPLKSNIYLQSFRKYSSDNDISDISFSVTTKAARKSYETDLQVQHDTVSSSKKEDTRKGKKTTTIKSRRLHEQGQGKTDQKEKSRILAEKRKRREEFRQKQESPQLEKISTKDSDVASKPLAENDEEYVDFKELLEARKLKRLKKRQQSKLAQKTDLNDESNNKQANLTKPINQAENSHPKKKKEDKTVSNCLSSKAKKSKISKGGQQKTKKIKKASELDNVRTTVNPEPTQVKVNADLKVKSSAEPTPEKTKPQKRVSFSDDNPSSTFNTIITCPIDSKGSKNVMLTRDPRSKSKAYAGQVIAPSVSELIEENSESVNKKRISLADYVNRKRKVLNSDDGRDLNEKRCKSDSSGHEISDSVGEIKTSEKNKSVNIKTSFVIHSSDWEDSNSPTPSPVQVNEECLIREFSGLINQTCSKKPVIDVNELVPLENPKDRKLQEYKEKVDSQLNSLNIKIPKAKPQGKTGKFSLDFCRSPQSDNLVKRFLRSEKLSLSEMEKIKKIISYKRSMQCQKNSPSKSPNGHSGFDLTNMDVGSPDPAYAGRRPSRQGPEDTLHRNIVNAKRKFQLASDDEDASSVISSQSDSSTKKHDRYSIINRLGEDGLPKIVFKRTQKNNVAKQPVVELIKLNLDDLADVRQKYNVTVRQTM